MGRNGSAVLDARVSETRAPTSALPSTLPMHIPRMVFPALAIPHEVTIMNSITRIYRSRIAAPPDEVFAWHSNPCAFERLTPPWKNADVVEAAGGIAAGDWKHLRIPIAGPLGFSWKLVHGDSVHQPGFVDIQEEGPFRSWRHEHRFLTDGDGNTMLEDRLTYELPYGWAGRLLAGRRIEMELDRLFRLRHRRTQIDLSRYSQTRADQTLRIAVTGSSGLVGRRLVAFLRSGGHEVVRLVRHPARAEDEIFWDPEESRIDAASLEGLDAVIHLAGVSIAGGRWTRSRKAAILSSRLDGTYLVSKALATLKKPPRVLVSTSGVGYYGDAGSETLTERSSAGTGFLAEVCKGWEAAAQPALGAGIRVVHPRFGVVLAGEGGLLPLISRVFQLGAGGPLGSGEQYMSWIALDDLVGVLLEAVTNESLEGPVNAVAPVPLTNREFSSTLAGVLHRPSLVRAPAAAMRLAGGELAEELILASQRAVPTRLNDQGFKFAFPTAESALRHELGRYEGGDSWDSGAGRPDNRRAA